MITQEVREIILTELPRIIKTDEEIKRFILNLSSKEFAGKAETESRFDSLLEELKRDREQQSKKWEEQSQLWREQDQKWRESLKIVNSMMEEIKQINQHLDRHDKRFDTTIGGLGARWGIYSEEAFRNGLRAILEESFHVEVININDWDDKGVVFGRPDQVELDIIIKNDHLIICELKSSISKAETHYFERKVRFYESRHQRKCDRMMIISPMVEPKAKTLAEELGIEVYSHSYSVKPEV